MNTTAAPKYMAAGFDDGGDWCKSEPWDSHTVWIVDKSGILLRVSDDQGPGRADGGSAEAQRTRGRGVEPNPSNSNHW